MTTTLPDHVRQFMSGHVRGRLYTDTMRAGIGMVNKRWPLQFILQVAQALQLTDMTVIRVNIIEVLRERSKGGDNAVS